MPNWKDTTPPGRSHQAEWSADLGDGIRVKVLRDHIYHGPHWIVACDKVGLSGRRTGHVADDDLADVQAKALAMVAAEAKLVADRIDRACEAASPVTG